MITITHPLDGANLPANRKFFLHGTHGPPGSVIVLAVVRGDAIQFAAVAGLNTADDNTVLTGQGEWKEEIGPLDRGQYLVTVVGPDNREATRIYHVG